MADSHKIAVLTRLDYMIAVLTRLDYMSGGIQKRKLITLREYLSLPIVLVLVFLVFCVSLFILFCLRLVSCLPNVASVSGFSIVDCLIGFI